MRISDKIIILLSLFLIFSISSCKKAGKEIIEKISSEVAEKTAKEMAQEGSEKSIKTLTKKELKSLDWSNLLKTIRKENINLADALSHLDGTLQKKLGKAIQSDYELYTALTSSNKVVDEFAVLTKDAPKAAKNIEIFTYFVKSKNLERRFGVADELGNIALREESGVIKFINKTDNSLLGEFRDGVFTIKDPFKSGNKIFDKNSAIKKTLIPNTLYKIKGSNGLSYLYNVDELGRVSKIEAKGIGSNELLSNVIYVKENINLGSEWASKLKRIKQTSKGNDIDASLVFKYADDSATPLAVKADIKANNKKIVSESFENLDNIATKANKIKILRQVEGDAALKALRHHKNITEVIEILEKKSPVVFDKKNLVVEELSDGSLNVLYKNTGPGSFTKINIKGNKIKAKGGSLEGEISAQNQFLNNPLPNMVYEIDEYAIYKTDKYGRVVEMTADRSKLEKLQIKRAGRDSNTQKAIRENFPGHDGGHLLDCASGGANERLNQVPMEKYFNRNGAWRELEKMEIKAVREGKDVKVFRKIIYDNHTNRPSKIISTIEIDGKKIIKELDNPMPA